MHHCVSLKTKLCFSFYNTKTKHTFLRLKYRKGGGPVATSSITSIR